MTSNNTSTEEDVKIGARIRKRRKALGISRKDLAAAFSVSPAQLSKYELGTNLGPADRIIGFADYLKVHVTYFFIDYASAEEADQMISFISSAEGIELNSAFNRIEGRDKRASISDLIDALADRSCVLTPA